MDKLYGTIKSDLIDNELETKVPIDPVLEPLTLDVPIDLYAAITSRLPDLDITTPITEDEAKTYAPVINRLYTQIVPEKPTILAEERIFVYVPKVSKDNAGIAKFDPTQFNIVNDVVSMKLSYLTSILTSNMVSPELILLVTELPEIGVANRLYLVINNETVFTTYLWNSDTNLWMLLGDISLSLDNYYTKAQITTLLNEMQLSIDQNKVTISLSTDEPISPQNGDFWLDIND